MSMNPKTLDKKRESLLNIIRKECDNRSDCIRINGMGTNESKTKYRSEVFIEKEIKLFEEDNDNIFLKTMNSEKDSDEEYNTPSSKRLKLSNISLKFSDHSRKESNSLDKLLKNIPFQRNMRKGFNTLQSIASNLKIKKNTGIVFDFQEMQEIIKFNRRPMYSKSHHQKRKIYELPQISYPSSIYNDTNSEEIKTDERRYSSSDFNIKLYRCNEYRYLSNKLITLIKADSSSD